MPTEKIGDLEPEGKYYSWRPPLCKHSEHNPPMRSFEPGHYKHVCPACGFEQHFTIQKYGEPL